MKNKQRTQDFLLKSWFYSILLEKIRFFDVEKHETMTQF